MSIKNLHPLVSVVICVYNGQRYLQTTLDSVLSQSYKNIEILIIDDGSVDNSLSIIKEFSERDKRIRWFKRANAGLPASRNYAFQRARGEWIAIIDQDDLCYPDRIKKQLAVAEEYPSAGLIFCDTDYINAAGEIIGSHLHSFNLPNNFIPKTKCGNLLLIKGCFIDSEAWFFKKKVAISLDPLIESLRYACDYEYFIRIGLNYDVAYTHETLSAWRIHPSQESATNDQRFHEHRRVLKSFLFMRNIPIITRVMIVKNLARSFLGGLYRWIKS